MKKTVKSFLRLQVYIWNIGYKPSLGDFEKRKLGIFNFMNLLGLLTGIVVPLAGLFFRREHLPSSVWLVAGSPALISFIVLLCNSYGIYELARMLYFMLY